MMQANTGLQAIEKSPKPMEARIDTKETGSLLLQDLADWNLGKLGTKWCV